MESFCVNDICFFLNGDDCFIGVTRAVRCEKLKYQKNWTLMKGCVSMEQHFIETWMN